MARAVELNSRLETALVTELDEPERAAGRFHHAPVAGEAERG